MNVLLVTEEGAGVSVLKTLARTGHRVVAVVTSPPHGVVPGATPWQMAQKLGHETVPPEKLCDPGYLRALSDRGVDLLLNVHSLVVLGESVLEVPRIGSFNLHPGPLPRYAGLNGPLWAIYRSEQEYGVTVHWMARGIDTGPVAYQTLFPLDGSETGFSLSARCIREGLGLLERLLQDAGSNPDRVPRVEQDLSRREYFGRRPPDGGRLDWSRTARQLSDFVRACDFGPFRPPWGRPAARLRGREVTVVKASVSVPRGAAAPGTVAVKEGGGVAVACGEGWLALEKILIDGTVVSPAELLLPVNQLD